MNELNKIQASMGKGKDAEGQAEKTMARVNQMQDAYMKYTATLEYREKEDAGSRAEEQREIRRLLQEIEEEQRAESAEAREEMSAEQMKNADLDEMGGFMTDETEEADAVDAAGKKDLQALKDAAELLKSQEREEKVRKRRHGKSQSVSTTQTLSATEYDTLRLKVRDLYRSNTNSSENGGMNLTL